MTTQEKQPFFSVLIPVFNGEKFISDCLEAILSQSFEDYDIIQYSFQLNQNCSSKDRKMGFFKTGELYGKEILKSLDCDPEIVSEQKYACGCFEFTKPGKEQK